MVCQTCHERGNRSQLVYSENRNAHGVYYPYYLCRHRTSGTCGLPSLPVAEVEQAVARHFETFKLDPGFVAESRQQLLTVLTEEQQHIASVAQCVRKNLEQIKLQEERLLDLASDGSLDTTTVRSRLRKLQLDKQRLEEELAHSSTRLRVGADNFERHIALLEHPGSLYALAPDNVRRQLLETFFSQLYVSDDLSVTSTPTATIATIQHAAHEYRVARSSRTNKRASLRKKGSSHETLAGRVTTDTEGSSPFEWCI